MRKHWSPCALLLGMYNGAASGKSSMAVPTNYTELQHDPAILLLSMCSKELKSGT